MSTNRVLLVGADGNAIVSTGLPIGKMDVTGDSIPCRIGLTVANARLGYNGSSWDRMRSKWSAQALASKIRTTETYSTHFNTYNARYMILWWDVTEAPGGDSVRFRIQGYHPGRHNYNEFTAGNSISAVDNGFIALGGGIDDDDTASDDYNNLPLPELVRVHVSHSAATAFTYSVWLSFMG